MKIKYALICIIVASLVIGCQQPIPTAKAADIDSDGLTNDEEKKIGTNPEDPDTDNDGLKDGEEVKSYGTSPVDFDTDGDGIGDGDEILKYKTNPRDIDSDDDGLEDGYEVMSTGTSPTSPDTDGDKLSDKDEIERFRTDPLKSDSDSDGINDYEEIKENLDPVNPDTDGDGAIDGADIVPNGNAAIVISIKYWEEKKKADFMSSGDPYFVVEVFDAKGKSIGEDKLGPFSDKSRITNVGSLWVDVPDDERSFRIKLQVFDSDKPWSSDEMYDINEDLYAYDLVVNYDVGIGEVTKKHDGSLDGSTKDLDGLIEFSIEVSGSYVISS